MNKTFFDFGSTLTSLDLNLILATHSGIGVIAGFDRGIITGNKLTITSDSPININQPGNADLDNEAILKIYQTCVARDGNIFVSTDKDILVSPISGSKNRYNEVLLFAQHTPVTDPVVNPVNLVAYWNTGSTSFYTSVYEPYTKHIDSVDKIFDISIDNLEGLLRELSFYNPSNMTLLGIYGTYSNQDTKLEESFGLPILAGGFPTALPKTDRVINLLRSMVIQHNEYSRAITSLQSKVTQLELDVTNSVSRLDDAIRRIGAIEAKSDIQNQ